MHSGRIAAALVALVAWTGLIVQLDASMKLADGSAAAALWAMARYFTVIANLLVAIAFTGVALRLRPLACPAVLGGVTLLILLVGVVYALLLRGLLELSGGAKLADLLLHGVTPVIVPLWWLILAPKGGLNRLHPILWATAPVIYFFYAIGRGRLDGNYAYPFMNVDRLGWPQTMINVGVMALGFVAAGYALVWIDRRLASRTTLS